jgi:hypothetical protein
MAAYLTLNPPARAQWYATRNRSLTGCTVLHGTESIFDEMGVDTGAENVARFIRDRTTPGSYHDLVDSDSRVHLVEYVHAAFHDGTGSNNWALALAFALRTTDWARMSPVKRASMLAHGARAFVEQQKYRKSVGAPLTRLRYISKAQSDAGESGFCCHGWRDPARRSDPGTEPPHLFPFDEWLDACATALAQHMPDHPDASQEDDMPLTDDDIKKVAERVWGHRVTYGGANAAAVLVLGDVFHHARRAAGLAAQAATVDVDEAVLARELAPLLAPAVVEVLGQDRGLTQEQVEAAIRRVLGSLDEPSPA